MMVARTFCLCAMLAPCTATALELSFPSGSVLVESVTDAAAPYGVAIGPASMAAAAPVTLLTAPRRRSAWQIESASDISASVLESLSSQLQDAGFAPLFTCQARACGGFDFRIARPVLEMPAMFVDLGEFTYLSANLPGATPDDPALALVSLIVSHGVDKTFVQVTEIAGEVPRMRASGPESPVLDLAPVPEITGVAAALVAQGHLALDALRFDVGSSRLSDDPAGTALLEPLAAYLLADGNRRIALVGHSDWTGSLDANIALSRDRAASVAAALSDRFGVARRQIVVQGIGYLAPRTSNETDTGRQFNRRVEAVVLPDAG